MLAISANCLTVFAVMVTRVSGFAFKICKEENGNVASQLYKTSESGNGTTFTGCSDNEFLRKTWNLPLNFRYFYFSARSSTLWLLIFMLYQPSQTVLWIDNLSYDLKVVQGV